MPIVIETVSSDEFVLWLDTMLSPNSLAVAMPIYTPYECPSIWMCFIVLFSERILCDTPSELFNKASESGTKSLNFHKKTLSFYYGNFAGLDQYAKFLGIPNNIFSDFAHNQLDYPAKNRFQTFTDSVVTARDHFQHLNPDLVQIKDLTHAKAFAVSRFCDPNHSNAWLALAKLTNSALSDASAGVNIPEGATQVQAQDFIKVKSTININDYLLG